MKIKKKTSLMLLSASAAAIVGVAAVSYAAWQGGVNEFTANASTGYVQVLGWNSINDVTEEKGLVPCDQENYDTNEYTNVITVEIPAYEYTVNHIVTIQSDNAELTLRYSYGTEETVTVDATAKSWAEIGVEDATTMETISDADATAASKTHEKKYVHIVLDSDNTKHMNQEFHVTIKLTETTASA